LDESPHAVIGQMEGNHGNLTAKRLSYTRYALIRKSMQLMGIEVFF